MSERAPQLFACDLNVGQTFSGAERLIDDEAFHGFAKLTGDDHPIHYDDAYAARTRFGKRLAHGLLLMSMTAMGATPMSRQLEESMVAFAEQKCRFMQPVFPGERVSSRFEVISIDRKAERGIALVRLKVELVNSEGQVVLEGEHAYVLRWQRSGASRDGA
jgi:3-hydroxybutyryl-CoA dehydratase